MRSGLLLLAVAVVSVGCSRYQGGEAFVGATTPVDYAAERAKPDAWKGDPGAFGGSADASGGLKTQTSYGVGARNDNPAPLDVNAIQPAKGTGQQAGENHVWSEPSHGNTNAPFAQAGPSGTPQAPNAR